MDNPNFLQYFWDLGSYDEKISVLSIEGIVNCLDSSVKTPSKSTKEKDKPKLIISLPELINGRDDLEYTLSRLIKGLESQRECVRRGYSSCLSIILNRYSIPISSVLEGLEKHYFEGIKRDIKRRPGSVGDTRDRIIGLLLGYLSVIKSGFFKSNSSRPYIEQTIENLWTVYNVKLYLQDIICEIIYLLVVDCCEYDPGLPVKCISSNLSKLFDSRVLETNTNEQKRNQLASQIPLLNLFLKLRLFLENNADISISGEYNSNYKSINNSLTVKINNNKWDCWNKVFLSPGYVFLKQRWEILLANIQYFNMFSPRIPNLFNTLVDYLLNSPCLNEKLSYVLFIDILNTIQEKYFSDKYSHQKCYIGGRMILQLLTQLKCTLYSGSKTNIKEKTFIKLIKEAISMDSKCFYFVTRTSLIDRNPLSSFSILFIQTFVGIITGNIFSEFNLNKENSEIKDYSSIIFGFDDYVHFEDNDKNKTGNSKPKSLVPFLLSETITKFFWERDLNSNQENQLILRLNGVISNLNKPLSISNEERVKLFWDFLRPIILKTGAKIKTVLRILFELIPSNENLDSLVLAEGFKIIDEIEKVMLKEEDVNINNCNENKCDKYNSDNESEDEISSKKINNCWRKIHWLQNILLEYLVISLNSRNNSIMLINFKNITKIVDSIVKFGSYEKEWVEDYRQLIYPRLEKIIGKITNDIVFNLDNNFEDNIVNNNSLIKSKIGEYNDEIIKLLKKTTKRQQYMNENTQKKNNNLKQILSEFHAYKLKSNSELSLALIINCLVSFYILEDCNCDFVLNIIINIIKSSGEECRLNLIINSILELDDINNDNNIDDENMPSCVSGLNLLFQLLIRNLNPSKNIDMNQFVQLTRKISQLPDLWNVNTHFNEEEDDNSDEDFKIDSFSSSQDITESGNNGVDENCDKDSQSDDRNSVEKDEILYYSDNSLLTHLLEEESQMPPKYQKQQAQKELEKQQLQKINSEMQNKLRMLDTLSLISDIINSGSEQKGNIKIPLIRSLVLLLEAYRIGCKHSLYYSIKFPTTVFSDYVNKLSVTINKIMHIDVLRDSNLDSEEYNDLSDIYKLLIHIISKPIVEPQKISRWSRKLNIKQLKLRMEKYSKQMETLSINLTIIIVSFGIKDKNNLIGRILSNELIKKWVGEKRMGIITLSYLTKLIHRIKNIETNSSHLFLMNNIILEFEDTIKYSKSSYQLREYTNFINQTLMICYNSKIDSNNEHTKHIDNIGNVIIKMIDFCTKNDNKDNTKEFGRLKFNTDIQSLELLNSLILLSKTVIATGERYNTKYDIIQRKILESNEFLNDFKQTCNSGKMKRQINKLKNIINNNKKAKHS
ncbi:hypothetical protein FG386_000191 [Cryptosporidium ryanae]|uniref:uncharacterized protein n=1 Tax=Cryptosporidium ryanae TaxID=515981 RepID=UPI00351A37FA|nr:hypothetical protein FG386_000191 [Cryptosporidium ryanae]